MVCNDEITLRLTREQEKQEMSQNKSGKEGCSRVGWELGKGKHKEEFEETIMENLFLREKMVKIILLVRQTMCFLNYNDLFFFLLLTQMLCLVLLIVSSRNL